MDLDALDDDEGQDIEQGDLFLRENQHNKYQESTNEDVEIFPPKMFSR